MPKDSLVFVSLWTLFGHDSQQYNDMELEGLDWLAEQSFKLRELP